MFDTSASLLEELRTRPSEQAWQLLVEIYDAMFRSWLRSAGVSSEDCDDLVQEILIVMMRKLPEFEHKGQRGSFRHWAKQVAFNCARQWWRAKKRIPLATGDSAFLQQLNQLEDPHSQRSEQWDQLHDRVVLQRLLDLIQLEVDQRAWQIFSRYVIKGEPAATVAETLGVKPGYVYVTRSRILSRLRKLAEGLVEGVDVKAWPFGKKLPSL